MHRLIPLLAAVALVLGACTDPPIDSPSPNAVASSPTARQTPPADSTLTPTPSSNPTATPRATLVIKAIPQELTTPTLDYRSDGSSLVYSSGAADPGTTYAPDLWRFDPETEAADRIFTNPNRDSNLPLVGSDTAGRYAFVETNARLLGETGWSLWLLPGAGEEPVEIDRSTTQGSTIPFFALEDGRLVWTATHGNEGEEPISQLLVAEPPSYEPIELASAPLIEQAFAFPDLDGSRLVYNSFEAVGQAQQFRAYLVDLSAGNDPVRLDTTGDVAMPLLHGDVLVWKRAPLNAYGWGILEYGAVDEPMTELDTVAMHSYPDVPFSYPSLGTRFLAAHDPNHNSLYVFDLDTETPFLVEDLGEERVEGERAAVIGRPSVAGSLLAYIQGADDPTTPLLLKYVVLPDASDD